MINFVPHTYETMGVEIVFSHYIFILAPFLVIEFFFKSYPFKYILFRIIINSLFQLASHRISQNT